MFVRGFERPMVWVLGSVYKRVGIGQAMSSWGVVGDGSEPGESGMRALELEPELGICAQMEDADFLPFYFHTTPESSS